MGAPKGNQSGFKHGGEGALKAIQHGRPFVGLVADVERAVREQLYEEGYLGMLEEIAVELHTVKKLFYAAVKKAASEGDLPQMDTFTKRYGWLANSAGRAWQNYVQARALSNRTMSYDDLVQELVREEADNEQEHDSTK